MFKNHWADTKQRMFYSSTGELNTLSHEIHLVVSMSWSSWMTLLCIILCNILWIIILYRTVFEFFNKCIEMESCLVLFRLVVHGFLLSVTKYRLGCKLRLLSITAGLCQLHKPWESCSAVIHLLGNNDEDDEDQEAGE